MTTEQIICGDCREVVPLLAEGSVDLVLTSPPYDNARDGAYASVSRDDLEAIGRETIHVLRPGGVFACVIDGPVNDRARSTLPFEMVMRWSALPGWRFLECLIFGRQGAPGAFPGRFRKDHEYMPVFVRDGAEHACDSRALATPSAYGSRAGQKWQTRRRRDGSFDGPRRASGWCAENGMTMPGTVWDYGCTGANHDPSCGTGHPATFPEALARDVVTVFSRPGDLVADWFAGSGTTLRAAKDLGRRGLGIEVDPAYCEMIRLRLAQGVLPLHPVPS